MSSRPDSRRRPFVSVGRGSKSYFRPEVLQLEDRTVPAKITVSTPLGDGPNEVRVALKAGDPSTIEIYIDNNLVRSGNTSKDRIIINGNTEPDTLRIDYTNGVFTTQIDFNAGATVVDDTIIAEADLNFTLTDAGLANSGGHVVTFSGVDRAEITGGAGANIIDASAFSGATKLSGLGGNDTILGGSGNDDIDAGDGDDVIDLTTGGSDTFETGDGNDTVIHELSIEITSLAGSTPGILVERTSGNSAGGVDTIIATGTTSTVSTALDEFLDVQLDDSEAGALSTSSFTFTGVYGVYNAGPGDNIINEDVTVPVIFELGPGVNTFNCNASGPVASGPGILTESPITIVGSGGINTLVTTNLSESVTIDLDPEDGSISEGGGAGGLSITAVLAELRGQIHNVVDESGSDTFIGNALNNVFDCGTGGNDTFSGFGGVDLISFASSKVGVNFNQGGNPVSQQVANGHYVNFSGIEGAIGSLLADVLSGDNKNNYLFGLAGSDDLQGQGGNDVLVGGNEVVVGEGDVINGGDGKDIIIGGGGADRLKGGSDEDILISGVYIHDTDLDTLLEIQEVWTGGGSYENRVSILRTFLNTSTVHDDGVVDTLTGAQSRDWFFKSENDVITDQVSSGKSVEFVEPEGDPLG